MELIPEIGIYSEIIGLTICPMEEEDVRARYMSMDRKEVPHHILVYLTADCRSKLGKELGYNFYGYKGSHQKNSWTIRSC